MFYFNFEGAIFGDLTMDPNGPEPILPYTSFIATRLLPCGPFDAKVQKFTGNDDPGDMPDKDDHLTMAIHAFAHFSVLYSKHSLLLCDLQGLSMYLVSLGQKVLSSSCRDSRS